MLGWTIIISREIRHADEKQSSLASWEALGLGGLDWLKKLVAEGRAIDLGGDGYPVKFKLTAEVLTCVLSSGPPAHGGPPVIGEDYFLPTGHISDVKIDRARLAECAASEELVVEAWDLS